MESQTNTWTLEAVTCNAGSATIPSAVVCLWNQDGTVVRDCSIGDGPIDAVFQAIERITGVNVVLQDYRLRSVTIGEDAQGEANVEVEHEGRTLTGRAVSTDVIEASAMAFLQVINRVLRTKGLGRIRPTETPES